MSKPHNFVVLVFIIVIVYSAIPVESIWQDAAERRESGPVTSIPKPPHQPSPNAKASETSFEEVSVVPQASNVDKYLTKFNKNDIADNGLNSLLSGLDNGLGKDHIVSDNLASKSKSSQYNLRGSSNNILAVDNKSVSASEKSDGLLDLLKMLKLPSAGDDTTHSASHNNILSLFSNPETLLEPLLESLLTANTRDKLGNASDVGKYNKLGSMSDNESGNRPDFMGILSRILSPTVKTNDDDHDDDRDVSHELLPQQISSFMKNVGQMLIPAMDTAKNNKINSLDPANSLSRLLSEIASPVSRPNNLIESDKDASNSDNLLKNIAQMLTGATDPMKRKHKKYSPPTKVANPLAVFTKLFDGLDVCFDQFISTRSHSVQILDQFIDTVGDNANFSWVVLLKKPIILAASSFQMLGCVLGHMTMKFVLKQISNIPATG